MTTQMAWYNEPDPFAASWLESLIGHGLISDGVVDRRTIQRIRHTPAFPTDLSVYPQCHFFAGIGGWSYALKLAGWSDRLPVWTGSCPCQPFSNAGSKRGTDDDRHLWPYFLTFIAKYLPPTIFGEQTAGPLGRSWLASVRVDLEELGYRVGAADLCAAGVGAPHIRQRLYWVAESNGARRPEREMLGRIRQKEMVSPTRETVIGCGNLVRLGDTDSTRVGERSGIVSLNESEHEERWTDSLDSSLTAGTDNHFDPWSNLEWLTCSDNTLRPTQPKLFPLADGVPSRVGRLRGYGNAIVPQLAAEFIGAYIDIAGIMR